MSADRAVFTLGRLPADGARRRFAEDLAERLEAILDGRGMPYGEAGRALGENHNQLRYAATTGRVLIRAEREAVEQEAAYLPLPGLRRAISVRWDG